MLSRFNATASTIAGLRKCLAHSIRLQRLSLPISPHATLSTTAIVRAAAVPTPHDHSFHFKLERYFAAAMFPLFPAAYFVHGPAMDYALTVALVLHIHWGLASVAQDYARPIVVGEKFAAIAPKLIYLLSAILLAALLHFNYNDVGLTKAFSMVFAL